MKNHYCVLIATALIISFPSCKKSGGSNNGGSQGSTLVRIQQGVDPAIINDSVWLLKYDSKNRLSVVTDSINQDTLTATYNDAGLLTNIQENSAYSNDQFAATYNSSGQLTEIDCSVAGQADQYVFTYNGALPSRCVFSNNAGSGSLFVWRTYGYTSSGGNITDIKEYDQNNTLIGERKLTYTTQANPFKTLSFFNWGGRLGTDDISFMETFFNANMPATTGWFNATNNPFYTTYQTTTNDKSGNPVEIAANEQYPDGTSQALYTWGFTYK